jgi:hypothetical protein
MSIPDEDVRKVSPTRVESTRTDYRATDNLEALTGKPVGHAK